MDATIDKWTYPMVPLTTIEDIQDSAKIAAQLAKIWALAQSDPTQQDSANAKYHIERLWHHFDNANKAAAAHSQAAWQYPLHLASRLHKKLDENPGHGTIDIVVHKFKHIWQSTKSDEFVATDDPNIISFVPILQLFTYSHGLDTNRYLFKVKYHSRSPSPLGTPTIPLMSPIPCSPSYHVQTPAPSPPLLSRCIRSPSPSIIISGANQNLINRLQRYTHPGPLFVKNRSDSHLCISTLINDANGNKGKAKYVQFMLNNSIPCAHLTMGRGHPVYAVRLQARPWDGAQSPFHLFRQRIFECDQPCQCLVDRTLQILGDPFIEGKVLQFHQLIKELQEAQQEVIDTQAEVRHAQQVELLASSTVATARQAINASIERFEQVGAYHSLHTHLIRQSFRHVGDDETMINTHDLLHCQLQAGGQPSSPNSDSRESPYDIDRLLEHFDDVLMGDRHDEPFVQDGGNDDGYYE